MMTYEIYELKGKALTKAIKFMKKELKEAYYTEVKDNKEAMDYAALFGARFTKTGEPTRV